MGMPLWTVLLVALGLSMDCFAVAIASGVAIKQLRPAHAVKIGLFFGAFQAAMPLAGWLAGMSLRNLVAGFDHWLAFGLLLFVGGKMIAESFFMKEDAPKTDPSDSAVLLVLSVATSIDALAVGLSFSFLKAAIVLPALVIGLVAFGVSFAGVLIGNKAGHCCEGRVGIAGGLILIGIGCRILFEHLRG